MRVPVDSFLDGLGFTGKVKRDKAHQIIYGFLAFLSYMKEGQVLEVSGIRLMKLDGTFFRLELNQPTESMLGDLFWNLSSTKLVKIV